MSIRIPNHSKLVNPFIIREEALICWSFAAVARKVVSSNLKPLFPKVCKTAPMEMKNSKGSNCWLPERCFVNSCYQMTSKASKANGKKTLQLEKRPSISPRIQWKSTSNPLETLRKEPAELKTDHESGTVPQSKIPTPSVFTNPLDPLWFQPTVSALQALVRCYFRLVCRCLCALLSGKRWRQWGRTSRVTNKVWP